MAVDESTQGGEHVRAVQRTLAIIKAFDADHPTLSLAQVAGRTDLSRGTAQRYLGTLAELGYVAADGRGYRLTARVLDLSAAYLASTTAWEVARVHLEALAGAVDESSSIAVLDGREIIYTVRAPRKRIFSLALEVGSRLPAYATSMGRVLLAHAAQPVVADCLTASELVAFTPRTITDPDRLCAELDRARRQGWYLLDQEMEGGLRSLAAPLRDSDGAVVAAVNISTTSSRRTLAELRKPMLAALLQTAGAIEHDWKQRRLHVSG